MCLKRTHVTQKALCSILVRKHSCPTSGWTQTNHDIDTNTGKNKKKWKIRKFYILQFLCPRNFKQEINIPHIVKFNSRSDLFSSIFRFQYENNFFSQVNIPQWASENVLWFYFVPLTLLILSRPKKVLVLDAYLRQFWTNELIF